MQYITVNISISSNVHRILYVYIYSRYVIIASLIYVSFTQTLEADSESKYVQLRSNELYLLNRDQYCAVQTNHMLANSMIFSNFNLESQVS